jgi:hypothetical protein
MCLFLCIYLFAFVFFFKGAWVGGGRAGVLFLPSMFLFILWWEEEGGRGGWAGE